MKYVYPVFESHYAEDGEEIQTMLALFSSWNNAEEYINKIGEDEDIYIQKGVINPKPLKLQLVQNNGSTKK